FDITHPAQVHFFRHLITSLQGDGHAVLVATRDKDVLHALLDRLGIPYQCLSRKGGSVLGMAGELAARNGRMLRAARAFRPHVMVGRFGVSITLPGKLLGVPTLVCDENDYAPFQQLLSNSLATRLASFMGYRRDYGRRQVWCRAVPMWAYLSPAVFTPDPGKLRAAGVDPDQPIILLRLVAWAAAHDVGVRKPRDEEIEAVVDRLSKFGRVLISSERPLTGRLATLANPVPIEHGLDLMALSALVIGESNTMAAEAATLGTPAVCCSPLRAGYTMTLADEYKLLAVTTTLAEGAALAEQWLSDPPALRARWRANRDRLAAESEDVTAFLRAQLADLAGRSRA
ncbi:MAG TPA: DUF354 domain-containing protein, partial [Tepidisphaeraceae bacterium]|nr:DUF354 domain-containing protein [Tepidisphaeraceae bacterium]